MIPLLLSLNLELESLTPMLVAQHPRLADPLLATCPRIRLLDYPLLKELELPQLNQ